MLSCSFGGQVLECVPANCAELNWRMGALIATFKIKRSAGLGLVSGLSAPFRKLELARPFHQFSPGWNWQSVPGKHMLRPRT